MGEVSDSEVTERGSMLTRLTSLTRSPAEPPSPSPTMPNGPPDPLADTLASDDTDRSVRLGNNALVVSVAAILLFNLVMWSGLASARVFSITFSICVFVAVASNLVALVAALYTTFTTRNREHSRQPVDLMTRWVVCTVLQFVLLVLGVAPARGIAHQAAMKAAEANQIEQAAQRE